MVFSRQRVLAVLKSAHLNKASAQRRYNMFDDVPKFLKEIGDYRIGGIPAKEIINFQVQMHKIYIKLGSRNYGYRNIEIKEDQAYREVDDPNEILKYNTYITDMCRFFKYAKDYNIPNGNISHSMLQLTYTPHSYDYRAEDGRLEFKVYRTTSYGISSRGTINHITINMKDNTEGLDVIRRGLRILGGAKKNLKYISKNSLRKFIKGKFGIEETAYLNMLLTQSLQNLMTKEVK